MVPAPRTASNFRSIPMHLTQVAYGGCWKCPQLWQRCSSRTPRLAASQNGLVHSFGTGTGLVTLLQSLIRFFPFALCLSSRSKFLLAHDLFRKPVPTFRDHALIQPIDAPCGAAEQSGPFVG